jgi:glucose-6-phosphate isomerase
MKTRVAWNELKFGERTFFPVVRKLKEMKEVVFDKRFLASANMDMELYYMFREVSKNKEDEKKIKENGLRYDITIMPAKRLGLEFVKTAAYLNTLKFKQIIKKLDSYR